LVGRNIYGFDLTELQARIYRPSRGRFVCMDAETGKLRWSTDRTGHVTALAADGKLYLVSDTGTLILAAVDATGYREQGRCHPLSGSRCWTAPSLANGRLFVRDQERAACLWVGDPQSAPAAADDRSVGAGVRFHFEWTRLLGREPEYPNDAPTMPELKRWFVACLSGVFAPAALAAVVVATVTPRPWRRGAGQATFWITAFVSGIVATPVLSTLRETFVCTWPASLYAAMALTLRAAERAGRPNASRHTRWQARGATLLFLAVVWGYYQLCKKVGLMTLWAFLPGFLPACLFAVPAAKSRWLALAFACDACGFAAYFWLSGLAIGWRSLLR
jgi:hypothetical protein